MGTKQAFKTYARTQRIQDTNLTFAKGINYTDAPLVEGFSRLLVNFDFGDDGTTLKPRKGLAVDDLIHVPDSLNRDALTIVDANQIMHDGKSYYQIIIGSISQRNDTLRDNVCVGIGRVITAYKEADGWHTSSKSLNGLSKCIFIDPQSSSAKIHGLNLKSTEYIKRLVGTFAFNGAYYYFTTDGALHYTYFDPADKTYKVNTVTPYVPLQYETQNSRYNMLIGADGKGDPYHFECAQAGSILRLTGFQPGTANEEDYSDWRLTINPKNGIEYVYKLWYTYPQVGDTAQKYYLRIEYNMGNDVWYRIPRDETEEYATDGKPFIIPHIKVDGPFAQFKIYALPVEKANFPEGSNQFTVEMIAQSVVLTTAFNYAGADREKSIDNLNLTRYNLSYARGLTYWKNRLWLFGAAIVNEEGTVQKQDNTILFASDPNRPDWFPYTANADIFDEEIIYLQPMLDELLVFTAHNLYSLTLDADGLSWTKKHLQANLNIDPWDLNLIQIVKNMVFFKSGNYFYMVVPKLTAASGAGLAIAPVSKNITKLLDNFSDSVDNLIDDLFNYSCVTRFGNKSKVTLDKELVHYYNYLDYEDIHNNYVFEVTKKTKTGWDSATGAFTYEEQTKLLTISLLYNTVSRTWRIYTLESDDIVQPIIKSATGRGLFAAISGADKYNTDIQILSFNNDSCQDRYWQVVPSETGSTYMLSGASIFPNWQYLDSGNLDQNSEIKKRFREYQFKIVNETNNGISFYSGFYLDRATRTYEMHYSQEDFIDEIAEEKVTIIDATPTHWLQGDPKNRIDSEVDVELLYQYTKLGSWKLGISSFPKIHNWKIRIPTSGKGYLPRLILISYNQTSYELLSCATVYRQLYSR